MNIDEYHRYPAIQISSNPPLTVTIGMYEPLHFPGHLVVGKD